MSILSMTKNNVEQINKKMLLLTKKKCLSEKDILNKYNVKEKFKINKYLPFPLNFIIYIGLNLYYKEYC